jgi:hypothetical protein
MTECDHEFGHHRCLTHDEDFPNNITADGHEREGCRMVWACHECGENIVD